MKKIVNLKNFLYKKIFIIAEIGHNHQGSIEIAKEMILKAKLSGVDAVKLQKRSNKNLYTKEFYNTPYDNENSYGKTYGLHRDYLEFNFNQYKALSDYAKKINIIFFATPFDFESVDFLEKVKVPLYKIASADINNEPLLNYIAKTKKPILLSTGGCNFSDINRAVKSIYSINRNLAIMHCTASYPCEIKDLNLNVIKKLRKKFKNLPIGLSDHENGIDAAPIAYMLGARIFEKHFTLNRSWKGTDQAFSLEPLGLSKMVRNLKRIPLMLGKENKKILKCEIKPINKMKKSIVAAKDLCKGQTIQMKDLAFKSPGGGLEPYNFKYFLEKKLKINLKKDELLSFKNVY